MFWSKQRDTNSLIVLCSFPQGYPGLLRELPRLRSCPADALALGVVNVPEIIQRSSLPNLQHAQQIHRNQSDQCYNYILKIHWHQTCFIACGLANYSKCWYAVTPHSHRAYRTRCGFGMRICRACHVVWLKTNLVPFILIKWAFQSLTELFICTTVLTQIQNMFNICVSKMQSHP